MTTKIEETLINALGREFWGKDVMDGVCTYIREGEIRMSLSRAFLCREMYDVHCGYKQEA